MQSFELYGEAWLTYLGLGIVLLALITYKIKDLSWNLKFGLISFIAVGAFTPDMVTNAETYAPLVISALLKAEIEGSSAIISGLIKLVIIWGIVFFSGLALRHFLQTRKNLKTES